ncbi:unnamed protein product [Spirodela intermedia]|uniref:Cupin type-1 domain-containing protein n=1 Tax=Spirodela intermedia TaxID=51605 RepID=A0A7I8J8A0_SPIIN|nr:unnamed protein product [Spirodela intermedia]CAA6666448.1 unnamed protein product [Spirodela intermedia]
MAGRRVSFVCWALCLGLLWYGSLAQLDFEQRRPSVRGGHRRFRDQSECRLRELQAQEPYWDADDQQFDCAGVAAVRHTVQPRGLVLPEFSNSPRSSTSSKTGGTPRPAAGSRSSDQHQKIRRFRQGDILALPAGVTHWCYNDGDTPVVAVTVFDTSSYSNQLDRNPRKFFLAGSQRREGWQQERQTEREEKAGGNIFSGFDDGLLAEAFGVSREVVRKLKTADDKRGTIVRVERGLEVVGPRRGREEEEKEERRREGEEERRREDNGLEETLCNARLRENIGDPVKADFYSREGGHIATLNSQKLPVLRLLQLSAEKGRLRRNAILAPHWNINAHSVIYCTRGAARIQIVGAGQRALYDGEIRRGQILIVPQGHAVVKQAKDEEFEWVSFKTNDNAMVSPLAGQTSVFRAIPEDVLANAYRFSVRRLGGSSSTATTRRCCSAPCPRRGGRPPEWIPSTSWQHCVACLPLSLPLRFFPLSPLVWSSRRRRLLLLLPVVVCMSGNNALR